VAYPPVADDPPFVPVLLPVGREISPEVYFSTSFPAIQHPPPPGSVATATESHPGVASPGWSRLFELPPPEVEVMEVDAEVVTETDAGAGAAEEAMPRWEVMSCRTAEVDAAAHLVGLPQKMDRIAKS